MRPSITQTSINTIIQKSNKKIPGRICAASRPTKAMPHQDAQVRNVNILGVGRRDGPERRVLEGERGPANDPQTVDKLCLDEFGATGHLTEA